MKSRRKLIWRLLSLALVILLLYLQPGVEQRAKPAKQWLAENQPGQYQVLAVNDGDTITINMNGIEERVRLIGIDTPELHHPERPVECYAREAQTFMSELLGNNQIRLQADPLDDNRDIYGRLLRYVYLPSGKFVNAEIVKGGYGFAYTRFPFAKKSLIKKLQAQARASQKGLWSACQVIRTGETLQTEYP